MNTSGDGRGVSGPANATAQPRPQPTAPQQGGTQDGPTPQELRASWQAYDGTFDGDDGPFPRQPGIPDLNVKSNRIRPVVNTSVDFLFGPVLSIKSPDEEAQAILDATWGDDDQRMTLLAKAGIHGGIYGHIFVKVVPPKRGSASADNPPRLILLNPELLRIETNAEDADLVARFVIEYATTDAQGTPMRKRQTITRVDPDDSDATTAPGLDGDTTWEVQNWMATGLTGGSFRPDGPALAWPYALPPIVDWQNYPNPSAHWGQRDVTDGIVALNRQLRLVESNINKIGFLQGHPYLFATGADTGGLKPTPGQIIDLGASDADLKAVDASGDLAQLMAFAEQLRSDMDEESGVPGVATGRMQDLPRGQLSGVTVRLLYSPLLARTEHKRRLYGQGIRQVCQTVLLICGRSLEEVNALDLELGWQDPLPQDDVALGQLALAKKQIGYSNHTLILQTGGDPDVEQTYCQEEQQAQMAAVTKGQALPPLPPSSATAPSAPNAAEPTPEGKDVSGKPKAGAFNPNHPAAQAARARVRAAFGKPPAGD